ncbi:carbohydrate ABC transporter permease [Streptomonospora nanhaiensis]|uniref:Multiple sugar transport system permease protein n=1 Tax=Streptomonospora nanhaiensis TaxID=1323731 RepID=A0A853BP88_9ACTN|nr:carbohydrate ABC transporter permease [Streptomonospora nanhaiensis]MBV2361927.1 carbohydrate ABC transporter permease [Streptomonospora nanhaiensis]MBX9388637.1 carbohydrate ABC transporter permease [Streptomonospora nanhaiensis]NYI96252.1 multiple sugar transport system permease protein [Streptomonospora nanhaiensis]
MAVHRRVRTAFTTVTAVAIVAVLLFPLYWMVNASFQPPAGLLETPPRWLPIGGTLEGYRAALDGQGQALLNSLAIAAGTVALTLLLSVPAAYALSRFRVRGAGVVLFALLLVQMVPGIVMANSLYAVMNQAGLLNTHLALILADSTVAVPFAVLILRAFMVTIPKELGEAAMVDGAGAARVLWSVILPVSRNAMITAALFAFLFAWADFLFAISLNTDDSVMPVTVGIYRFIGAHTADWNSVMATGVIASIPAAVLLVAAQRYVAAGVTGGALKD